MRYLLLLLLSAPCFAQTVTVSLAATASNPTLPAGTTLCTVPKNGGACKATVPIVLSAPKITIPVQTFPVTSTPQTVHFSCAASMLPSGQPDFTKPLSCAVTQ